MSFHVIVNSVSAHDMRYDTAGDWVYGSDTYRVVVAEQADPRYEALVAIHELVECVLCKFAGITVHQVDEFDMHYTGGEAGDSIDAPYVVQHEVAEIVERVVAQALGVHFAGYLEEIGNREYGRGTHNVKESSDETTQRDNGVR